MNIKGQGHSLTLVQGHSELTFSNFFFLETAKPIEANFHVEPQWDKATKNYSNGPGDMTKMAAIPIYGIKHCVLKYYQVCSNDAPGLTLTYFTARSNLVPYAFVWEKVKQCIFQKLL